MRDNIQELAHIQELTLQNRDLKSKLAALERENTELKNWPKCEGHEMPKEAELIKRIAALEKSHAESIRIENLTLKAANLWKEKYLEVVRQRDVAEACLKNAKKEIEDIGINHWVAGDVNALAAIDYALAAIRREG